NISLRPYGQKEFGTKNELKNLNSFNYVRKGLAYEEKRQAQVLNAGGVIEQATRRYDESTGKTQLMRVKEGAADYRYFPEPDLLAFTVADAWLEDIQATRAERPPHRQKRYVETYELRQYDVQILTQSLEMCYFFDATVKAGAAPKQASIWLMGEVKAYM